MQGFCRRRLQLWRMKRRTGPSMVVISLFFGRIVRLDNYRRELLSRDPRASRLWKLSRGDFDTPVFSARVLGSLYTLCSESIEITESSRTSRLELSARVMLASDTLDALGESYLKWNALNLSPDLHRVGCVFPFNRHASGCCICSRAVWFERRNSYNRGEC